MKRQWIAASVVVLVGVTLILIKERGRPDPGLITATSSVRQRPRAVVVADLAEAEVSGSYGPTALRGSP